jgi:hypothetical protein
MEDGKGTLQNGEKCSENLDHAATHATYLEGDEVVGLSEEHRKYLLNRHGTLELDPLPTMVDEDPYNWPSWKVRVVHRYHTRNMLTFLENHQPHLSGFPRVHGNLHRSSYHTSV